MIIILLLLALCFMALGYAYSMVLRTTNEINPPINKNPEQEEPNMGNYAIADFDDEFDADEAIMDFEIASEFAKLIAKRREEEEENDEDEDDGSAGARVPALV